MNTIVIRAVCLLIGYAFGNISPGLIFTKLKGIDLRKVGSGNVGSTNVSRALGFKMGIVTLICDCMKAIVPAIIAYFIFRNQVETDLKLFMAYAAFGAVMGHIFPVLLKFKGGKGIATSLGFLIIAEPLTLIGCVIVFFAAVLTTRYVSLGSLMCALVLPLEGVVLAIVGMKGYSKEAGVELCVLFMIDALVCAYKHKENMIRLINHTENKFYITKGKKNE